MLTTKALVAEKLKEEKQIPPMPPGADGYGSEMM